MRPGPSPLQLLAFVFLLGLLVAFVQVGVLTIAFEKLGLSAESGLLLLFTSLFGSMINLPLFTVTGDPDAAPPPPTLPGWRMPPYRGRTVVAVNVGGCVIPVAFSGYLLTHNPVGPGQAVVGVALVAVVSHAFSRPIRGLGIGMPILVAPISAALAGVLIAPDHSAPLAYIAGTLGVLVGADLLRLRDIPALATPWAAIGGAGTFDGIFLTGIVAVLLA